MYDIYGEYRAPPDDRLNTMFRDQDFYSRLREFTLDGEVDVLSYVFPEATPRPSRLVTLSVTRFATTSSMQHATWVADQRPPNLPLPKLLVESSSQTLRQLTISNCTPDFDQLPIVVRQLTHLSLTYFTSPRFESHLTIKKLLFILRANPGLEEFFFYHGESGLKADDNEDLPFVSFTHLRKLRVVLQFQDVALLLQHLRIMSEVEEVKVKVARQGPIPEKLASWFNDAVSPHAVQCIEARPASHLCRPG
jgi:hypothetical protein